jgi:outer membrane protein OmpA-like peptidoglycan-associated protein
MSRSLYAFLLLLLLSFSRVGAENVPARARHAYEAALRWESKHDWERAERHILKAIKEYPAYTDAYITYGNWLLDRHLYSAAARVLTDAEHRCGNGPKIFQKPLAKSLLYSGNVDEAIKRFPPVPKDSFWKALVRQAANMKELMRRVDTSSIIPIAPPWRINTADPELFPSISADGQTFYFTRRIKGIDEDFFYAKRDTCDGWFAGINMGSPPNTLQQEAAQFVSADGHYLFFMRCDNRTISGWDQGGCDLLMAYRADSIWSVPQSFGATINTPGYEGMPCLSSDNRELYFVSDREGGYGGLDIWSSRFEHGLWQMPRNLGPTVNTSGDETAPFVYADNNTLFFASTGKPGMGGSDLFMSRRLNDTSWSEALNLGPKVNTPFDETSLSLNAKGDTAYFASDRDSVAGNFDIYQFRLPHKFQPSEVMYLKGYVYDSISKDRLNYASVYITDNETGKDLYQVQSNRGDGSYTIALPVGHSYHFLIDRISYQSITDSMRMDDSLAGQNLTHNISLLPFDYQKPITDSLVSTVFFIKNSVDIADSAKAKLAASLAPYKGVVGVTILVNGYTDNSGTPMLNEQLSYTRARLVADLIKASGFPTEIVQSQGWGEANPKADNDTDEHRDMNRRVEIVVRQ